MGDYTHEGLTLVGRHVPEPGSESFKSMAEAQAAGHDTINPVTGMYEIGVLIDGAFVPVFAEKASLVFDRVDLAKQQQAQQQQQQEQAQQQTQGQSDAGASTQTQGQQPS